MRPDPSETGTHGELKNLVAALVLGVCDEDERLRARLHLQACRRCAELTRRFAEAVEIVPLAVEGTRPPRNLRGRILYGTWPLRHPETRPWPVGQEASSN
jgi:hypothetical protein